jgi:hypothetical protein
MQHAPKKGHKEIEEQTSVLLPLLLYILLCMLDKFLEQLIFRILLFCHFHLS